MSRVRGALPLGVSIAVLMAAAAFLAWSNTLNPIDALMGRGAVVTVPDVVGRPQPRAVAELEEAGLDVQVVSAFSLQVPRGSVVGQDPHPGERIREGEVVELAVSRGAHRVEMPDAVGHRLSEVRAPLDDADIPLEIVEVPHERVGKGIVISQSPDPGIMVTGDDTPRFEVSSGPAERPVPEVLGLSLHAAAFRLGDAGLTVGEVTFIDHPSVPSGAVASVDPAVGAMLPRDAAVDVVISNGPTPVAVPRVVNTTSARATDQLEALGFVVATATRLVGPDGQGAGAVFEQFPEAGSKLRPGEVVTIVIGRVPPEPPPPAPPTTLPPPPTAAPPTPPPPTTVPPTTAPQTTQGPPRGPGRP